MPARRCCASAAVEMRQQENKGKSLSLYTSSLNPAPAPGAAVEISITEVETSPEEAAETLDQPLPSPVKDAQRSFKKGSSERSDETDPGRGKEAKQSEAAYLQYHKAAQPRVSADKLQR
ncbi:hypothetical protein AK812_SmicGene47340, partial [Symbiodinium microadriaticum]